MFLCSCPLFASRSCSRGRPFWYDRISQAFGTPHVPFASGHRDLRRLGCSPARRLSRLQISLFSSSLRSPALFPKRNSHSLSLHSLKIMPILHLYTPPKKNSSATSLLKTVLSTVRCFDIFRIFPQRTKFFFRTRGRTSITRISQTHTFPFTVPWNHPRKQCCWNYRHEESLDRNSQTGARVGVCSHLVATEVARYSCALNTKAADKGQHGF